MCNRCQQDESTNSNCRLHRHPPSSVRRTLAISCERRGASWRPMAERQQVTPNRAARSAKALVSLIALLGSLASNDTHRAGACAHASTTARTTACRAGPASVAMPARLQDSAKRRRPAPSVGRASAVRVAATTPSPTASPRLQVCPTPAISCEAVAAAPCQRGHAAAPCRIRPGAAASLVSFIALFGSPRTPTPLGRTALDSAAAPAEVPHD